MDELDDKTIPNAIFQFSAASCHGIRGIVAIIHFNTLNEAMLVPFFPAFPDRRRSYIILHEA
jgi:hypothetical protein